MSPQISPMTFLLAKILSFFRLMLTTHFFTYGLFVSLVAYSMKTDSEYFSYRYCVVLLTLLSILLFLSMVVFVPWTSQEVRLSYKREKSMLANASIVLIALGTILVIYALVWLSAIVAILLPVDVMLLSLATTFRFISTALGPSLFIALKWRGAGYFSRYDLVVSAFSLGMNFVAAIVMFFDTVVNTDWNARVTFTFPQGLYLVGYLIMALGFGLGITAAYLVNRSCEKGFASLIPSVDDAVYPPPVMPGSNSLPPPMYSPPGSVAANYQQQAVLLQYDK